MHPADNVAVALEPLQKGETVAFGDKSLTVLEDIPQGHKIAFTRLNAGEKVVKYGFPIGRTTSSVEKGAWVHVHNVKTGLDE